MAIRRGLMAQGNSPYRFVSYLQYQYVSGNDPYIDTLTSLGTDDFTAKCSFELTQTPSAEYPIFSIWTSTNGYWNCFVTNYSALDCYTVGHHVISNRLLSANVKYDATLQRSSSDWSLALDNVASTTWQYTPSTVNNTTIKLFKRGDVNGNPQIRIYGFELYVNGSKTLDLKPCFRLSDNKTGMYDTVSGTFLANAGTGEFIIPS